MNKYIQVLIIFLLLFMGIGSGYWYYQNSEFSLTQKDSKIANKNECGSMQYTNELLPRFSFEYDSCEFDLVENDAEISVYDSECSLNLSIQNEQNVALVTEENQDIVIPSNDFLSGKYQYGYVLTDSGINYFKVQNYSGAISDLESSSKNYIEQFSTQSSANTLNYISVYSDTINQSCVESFNRIVQSLETENTTILTDSSVIIINNSEIIDPKATYNPSTTFTIKTTAQVLNNEFFNETELFTEIIWTNEDGEVVKSTGLVSNGINNLEENNSIDIYNLVETPNTDGRYDVYTNIYIRKDDFFIKILEKNESIEDLELVSSI